ncbi:hypothetical protein D3C77_757930 [compost metagenome]
MAVVVLVSSYALGASSTILISMVALPVLPSVSVATTSICSTRVLPLVWLSLSSKVNVPTITPVLGS